MNFEKLQQELSREEAYWARPISLIQKRILDDENMIKSQVDEAASSERLALASRATFGAINPFCIDRLEASRKELSEASEGLERGKSRAVRDWVYKFVQSTINRQQFFLAHDLISMIDAGTAAPSLDVGQILRNVRAVLDVEALIRNTLEDPDGALEGLRQIQKLEDRLYYLLADKYHLSVSPKLDRDIFSLQEFLFTCLRTEPHERPLIRHIVSLGRIPSEELKATALRALNFQVGQRSLEKASAVCALGLIPSEIGASRLKELFQVALEKRQLELAQFVIELNKSECPISRDELLEFFDKAIVPANHQMVRLICRLAGSIPEPRLDEALRKAKKFKSRELTEYLTSRSSAKCLIS